MNHMLLGALVPFLLAGLLYAVRGFRASLAGLVLTPLAMATGAVWAVIPDLPRLLRLHDLYLRLSQDPRMNVFFWHYTIDQLEPDSSFYAAGIFVMAALLMGVALRELHREERS